MKLTRLLSAGLVAGVVGCGDVRGTQPIFLSDTPGGLAAGMEPAYTAPTSPVYGYGSGSGLMPPTVPGYRTTILPSGEPVTCMTSGGNTFSTATCW